MEEKILRLYAEEQMSMSKIANTLGISSARVKRVLVKNNVEIRSNNYYKAKEVDTNFFL